MKALVIGSGSLGRRVLHELTARSVDAAAASRSRPEGLSGRWRPLDATDASAVQLATRDTDLVLLCAAPPLAAWKTEFEPLVRGTLQGVGGAATLVFASNMSPYGPHPGPLTEATPEAPAGPNARLRARLDAMVLAAHGRESFRTAVVRASSFYGPGVDVSVAGSRQIAALAAGEKVDALGSVDQPHSLCFIDDVARALVDVALDATAHGQVWHAPVQAPMTLREFMSAVGDQLGMEPRFRVATPSIVALLGLFNPDMRALRESLYSFTAPFIVEDLKYRAKFGTGATPLGASVMATAATEGVRSAEGV